MIETEKTYTMVLDAIDFALLYDIVCKAEEYDGEDGIDKRLHGQLLMRLKEEMYDALYDIR